jgi:hypothetical protein
MSSSDSRIDRSLPISARRRAAILRFLLTSPGVCRSVYLSIRAITVDFLWLAGLVWVILAIGLFVVILWISSD